MSLGSAAAGGVASKKTPSDFLKSVLGRPVIVKLNSGVSYRGVLACLDGHFTRQTARGQRDDVQTAMERAHMGDGQQERRMYGIASVAHHSAVDRCDSLFFFFVQAT